MIFTLYSHKLASNGNKTVKMLKHTTNFSKRKKYNQKGKMLRVGFEPTPFRTRTLIWRLRPTRPSQLVAMN